ncbi:MAG: DUF503 domain-containing protein [Clostridium sp.]|nr:DUF503 domain-containing protein [Clostridium sp.]
MVIGVCQVVLYMDEAFSLKEKRKTVKSLIERLRSRFNASVAEVELNDKWKNAVIGISCISNETAHVDSMMASMVNFIENDTRVVLSDYSTENIHVDYFKDNL